MANVQRTADSIRYLAGILQDLPQVAEALDRIGSLEAAENDLNAKVSKATEQKALVLAELAEAKSGVLLIRDQGEKLVREAEDKSQSLLDNAKAEAEKLLSDAKEKAEGFAQSALDNLNQTLSAVKEECEKQTAKLDDLTSKSQAASADLYSLESDKVEAELKLKAVKDELAAIFARHQGE